MWDLDSGDTASGANKNGSISFYDNLANEGSSSKHLTLSHEVQSHAVDAAVNHTVEALRNAKITLLTVAECLDTDPYERVGDYGIKDDTWTCGGTWTPSSTPGPSTPAPTTPTPTNTTPTSTTPTNTTPTNTTPTNTTPTNTTPTNTTPTNTTPTNTTPTPTNFVLTTPSSPPLTTTTPTCKETYTSVEGDDCTKIEAKYNLVPGTLKAANSFVTCNDIWTWTRLCIPDGPYNSNPTSSSIPATTSAPACKQTYTSAQGDTCASIENRFGLMEGTIKNANSFLTCTDIWARTPICVPDGPYTTAAPLDQTTKLSNKIAGPPEPSCVTQNYQSLYGETW